MDNILDYLSIAVVVICTGVLIKASINMWLAGRQATKKKYVTTLRHQIEQLSQADLSLVFCAALVQIDDEHLRQALEMASDDDLGTLVAMGIIEQRERERAVEVQ